MHTMKLVPSLTVLGIYLAVCFIEVHSNSTISDRNKRFLLEDVTNTSTICCQCDDQYITASKSCTSRCESTFHQCFLPNICATTTVYDGSKLFRRLGCVHHDTCLADRSQSLHTPGCKTGLTSEMQTGTTCNYCCLTTPDQKASREFDICIRDGAVPHDNMDLFVTPGPTAILTTANSPPPSKLNSTTSTTTTMSTTMVSSQTVTTTAGPISTTVPSRAPLKSTTTEMSTTLVSSPTSTIAGPTSATVPSRSPLKPPLCEICDGAGCHGKHHVVECDVRENYCISVLKIDTYGNYVPLKKGCASKYECLLDHSSLNNECHPNFTATTPFISGSPRVCQYCCDASVQTEPCNKEFVSENITDFDTSTPSTVSVDSWSSTTIANTDTSTDTVDGTLSSTTIAKTTSYTTDRPYTSQTFIPSTVSVDSWSSTTIANTDTSTDTVDGTLSSTTIIAKTTSYTTDRPYTSQTFTPSTVSVDSWSSTTIANTDTSTDTVDGTLSSTTIAKTTSYTTDRPYTSQTSIPSTVSVDSGSSTTDTIANTNVSTDKVDGTVSSTMTSVNTTSSIVDSPYTSPTSCAVCADTLELCEQLYLLKRCDGTNNYCFNIIQNRADGSRTVNRTCGNYQMCRQDWYVGTSDSDKCQVFDGSETVNLNFDCTYCCIEDKCNVPLHPSDSTLYSDKIGR